MVSQTAVIESGSSVVIRVGQEHERWTIVAPYEADPLRRRISEMSPLGFALLGRRPGETVTVRGPSPYTVTVVAIG
jgi:transcription elongation GreA/GreB family factor